jgi:hypothetical protein
MDIELCLIGGVSVGIEIMELDKKYLVIDLGIVRVLLSRNDDDDVAPQ